MKDFGLRTKVLFPVAIMLITVIVVALVVVNQVVRRQVQLSVTHELEKSQRIFLELQRAEYDLLAERCWVIAETPQLKAALDTRDSTTVQHVADELFATLGSDLLFVSDQQTPVLARCQAETGRHIDAGLTLAAIHLDSLSEQSVLVADSNQVIRLLSVPVLTFDQIAGIHVLGRVTVGKALGEEHVRNLKNLVECEVALVSGGEVRASTIVTTGGLAFQPELAAQANRIDIAGEEYVSVRAGLSNEYVLLKSVDQAFNVIMQPVQKTMVVVGIFALVAALLIGSYISYGIVSPVEKLARATEKLSAGDYGIPIHANSGDEIGQLAAKFEEMRLALHQKMTQLNERNDELEYAMRQLKEAQDELVRTERLAATGKITAQLSHELNNPIHNIQSCLEAAQKKIGDKVSGREFVDLAYDEILRIGKLTRQMLDFYRPYAQSKQPVDIDEVIEDVLLAGRSALDNGRVVLRTAMAAQAGRVMASPDQLKQVFLNLYLNALDAMPDGGTLTVSTFEDAGQVCAAFEDSGCGIPEENLDRIFDAFFTTKSEANGVGLGLSVSYGVIQSHGGTIAVTSQIGKGSRFVVRLPRLSGTEHASVRSAGKVRENT
ncbi:MAG TPA: ATP-binding protein [bacterium]